jgi:hypothetical protein
MTPKTLRGDLCQRHGAERAALCESADKSGISSTDKPARRPHDRAQAIQKIPMILLSDKHLRG